MKCGAPIRTALISHWINLLLAVISGSIFAAEIPRLEDPRFEISLFAQEPDIWTPTGVAVDSQGAVYVIESNTHLPKSDYPGPKTDRIKRFADTDNDGKPEKIEVFAEGFRAAMSLSFGDNGELFVVQRDKLLRLPVDSKTPETLLHLETKGDFAHNGLGGFCVGPDGMLYIGLGENLGEDYTLKGRDNSSVSGGGEGGSVFRCKYDGTKLELFATGFWNPFALAFDNSGNLFTVDNDPDGRPPCRLIHVIAGGNYGYQFRYGRSGLHPFVAWDGELPGTLPMVAGTGEAPSGLVWCQTLGWPAEYEKSFLGSSWGENLIETYPLESRGISFKSERKALARGDQSFRPVAFAGGPDGSVYVTDWADREYAVHQKGRIWRLKPKVAGRKEFPARMPARGNVLRDPVKESRSVLIERARSDDPFVRSTAVAALSRLDGEALRPGLRSSNSVDRLSTLLALRLKGEKPTASFLKSALQDEAVDVRRMAIIWAAEHKQKELLPEMSNAALKHPQNLELLQTYLAAQELLSGYERKSVWDQGSAGAELVERLLKEESQPIELRELARKLKSIPQARPVGGAPVAEPARRPETEGEWLAAIGFGGQPEQGRLLFYGEKLGCAKCHRALGEGGQVGPDLSRIANSSDRARLVNSILQPSANIGPLYVTHHIKTKSGEEYAGLVPDAKLDGKLLVILADGNRIEIPRAQIVSERASNISLMPAGLEAGLSVGQFADLISFLQTLR